tara:strand:+ start:172 stop:393 length:222 start_codon:yes stop_codon:yes gene_type:complete
MNVRAGTREIACAPTEIRVSRVAQEGQLSRTLHLHAYGNTVVVVLISERTGMGYTTSTRKKSRDAGKTPITPL